MRSPIGKPLKISWFTDLHLLDSSSSAASNEPLRHGVMNIAAATERLRAFVDHVNRRGADAALCTGDIIDSHQLWRARQAANASAPPASTCGGSGYDARTHLRRFASEWKRMRSDIAQLVTVGNHDVMAMPRRELASAITHVGTEPVAGSPFNRSVAVSNGEVAARFILIDTSVGADAAQWCYTGTVGSEVLEWIAAEASSAREPIVFLCMHHGPHKALASDPLRGGLQVPQFSAKAATALATLVESIPRRASSRRCVALFGHEHGVRGLQRFDNLGPRFPGYQCPCAVDYHVGKFAEITVQADGEFAIAERTLQPADRRAHA